MSEFSEELRLSLRSNPKIVHPKWLYDQRGSELFEQICVQPEYYPTLVERRILTQYAKDIVQTVGPGAELVEFGAGASIKVSALLGALTTPSRYVAVDISGQHLEESLGVLRQDHSHLDIRALVADFTGPLELPPSLGQGVRLGLFFGSSIGNFEPDEARKLLATFRGHLSGGYLLIGVDLLKDPAELHQAYNDAAGVTAEFNLNLLVRANKEAHADFDPSSWRHYAFMNVLHRRIEMHLISSRSQVVHVAGEPFEFREGESIWTECSYKYTLKHFCQLATSAGWETKDAWTDSNNRFALVLLAVPRAQEAAAPRERSSNLSSTEM